MKKGFTVIELLVVIAIVALLLMIAIPSFLQAKKQARMNEIGIKQSGDFYYNPDTKEVVELNDDQTQVIRVIGKISVNLIKFEATDSYSKHKLISYCDSPAKTETIKEEIIVNGVTYKRTQ